MFQLGYFDIVHEILFHDEEPAIEYMNEHENILEIIYNKTTEEAKRQQVMLERPPMSRDLHAYIQSTYPAYFGMPITRKKTCDALVRRAHDVPATRAACPLDGEVKHDVCLANVSLSLALPDSEKLDLDSENTEKLGKTCSQLGQTRRITGTFRV